MRTVAARLSKLEIVWQRQQVPVLEVVYFEDDEGHQLVRLRSPGAQWKVIQPRDVGGDLMLSARARLSRLECRARPDRADARP